MSKMLCYHLLQNVRSLLGSFIITHIADLQIPTENSKFNYFLVILDSALLLIIIIASNKY